MIQLILRSLVYLQPFLWLYLLDIRKEFENIYIKVGFGVAGITAYFLVLMYQIGFSQYPARLLSFYILMVLLCTYIFHVRYSFKDSVSLAFLIVFINSYYWESMLHFNAILFYGVSYNQIIQAFHLIPAFLLMKRITFYNERRAKKILLYGLIISCLNVISRYVFDILFNAMYLHITHPVTRLSCLGILIYVVLSEIKKIKKRK